MRTQLMLLLTLSALLTYRPGHAQAHSGQVGESPTFVASAKTKPVAHTAPEVTSAKTVVTAKKETAIAKKSSNSINRIWSRIMGYCHEVHQASQKKS